jgi:hypothetical protein
LHAGTVENRIVGLNRSTLGDMPKQSPKLLAAAQRGAVARKIV